MHVAWLKPGRHTYTINYDPNEVVSDGEEGKKDAKFNLFMNLKLVKGKKSKRTFYLHDMLATYREEKIPLCKSLIDLMFISI